MKLDSDWFWFTGLIMAMGSEISLQHSSKLIFYFGGVLGLFCMILAIVISLLGSDEVSKE